MASPPLLLLWTADPKVVRSVESVAGEQGLVTRGMGSGEPADPPAVVVVDLDAPGALDALVDLRDRWPEALVAGHLGLPDRDRWLAAERAGCDLVANRGALAAALRKRLAAGAPRRGRRVPLFALADAAGRLGCVHREAPGTVATLSEGELERGVVTCPRHGSQFDVATGERLRGPADTDIPTYPTIEDGGQLYLLVAD